MSTNAVAGAVGRKAAGRKRSMVQRKKGESYMRLTVFGSVPDGFGHSCLPSRWKKNAGTGVSIRKTRNVATDGCFMV